MEGESEEKNQGAGDEERKDWRACETFFNDPLQPAFVAYLDNWISAVEMSICQFTDLFSNFSREYFTQTPSVNK